MPNTAYRAIFIPIFLWIVTEARGAHIVASQ